MLSEEQFYTDAEIQWFGPHGGLPNWADPKAKQVACLIQEDAQCALLLMFNADTAAVDFCLPAIPSGTFWRVAVDTSRDAPLDLFSSGAETLLQNAQTYQLSPRSSVILLVK